MTFVVSVIHTSQVSPSSTNCSTSFSEDVVKWKQHHRQKGLGQVSNELMYVFELSMLCLNPCGIARCWARKRTVCYWQHPEKQLLCYSLLWRPFVRKGCGVIQTELCTNSFLQTKIIICANPVLLKEANARDTGYFPFSPNQTLKFLDAASLLFLLLPPAVTNRSHQVRENYKTSLLKSNVEHFRLSMYNSLPSQGIII